MTFLRVFFGIFLGVFLMGSQGLASHDQAQIKKIEDYLNGLTTLTAFFTQLNPNGSLSEGRFYLSRPGKLRFDYTRPAGQVIVADGQNVYFHDPAHEETSLIPLDSSPAGFLLEQNIVLGPGSKNQVLDVAESRGRLQIVLTRRQDPEAGTLTLTFRKNPLRLVQWIVKDAQRLETTVNLDSLKMGAPIDPARFLFTQQAR